MTTYQDLLKVSHGIRQCIKLPGKKFALACVENHRLIKTEMEKFNAQYPNVEGFEELQKQFQQELSKFKPEEGELRSAYESKFREENAELIAAQEALEKAKDEALNNVIEGFPGWTKIRKSDLPEVITVEQLAAIEDIIA